MRISDWSSDVCSSDLFAIDSGRQRLAAPVEHVDGAVCHRRTQGKMNVIVTQVSQVEAGAEGRVFCGAVGMQQLQASVDARLVYRAGQIQIGGVAPRPYGNRTSVGKGKSVSRRVD